MRDYPELVLVKTTMADGTRAAFGRLFDYISGENGGRREIAMTALVIETKPGAEIAMTAPVLQDGGAGGPTEMGFVLPAEFTAATAPLPADPAVTLAVVPARRVATIRFSGSADPDDVAESRVRLEAWMAERGLAPAGAPELAQYNPPWTISALRRNELLIPVAER